jgi:hypothetical protein
MLKLTYKDLRNPQFMGTFMKLASFNGVSTKTAINIGRIKRVIDSESEIAQEAYVKMIKVHAELDEKGEIKPIEGQPNTFQIPEANQKAFGDAFKEFEKTEFEIPHHAISYREIDGVRLSAVEVMALDAILVEEESGPKGVVKQSELPANA